MRPTSSPIRQLAAGLIASGPPLLVLVAWHLATARPGLLEVVSDGVVRYVPLAAFEQGLALFGPLAKGLLYAGVAAGAVTAGSFSAALLLRRARSLSPLALGATAAIAAFAAAEAIVLPLAGAGFFGIGADYSPLELHVPVALASLTYGATIAALRDAAPSAATGAAPPAATGVSAGVTGTTETDALPAVSRRRFIGRSVVLVGLGSLALSALGIVTQIASAARHGPASVRTGSGDSFGPTPALTPVPDFYQVAKDVLPPSVEVASWRLSIDGLVDRPERLSLDALRALPSVEGVRTLECISTNIVRGDHLISNQRWRGVPVSTLLDRVGVRPDARFVLWEAEDGYVESLPLDVARHPETWIAYEMGGAALTIEHGFPARVLIAGRFGMKQPKWVRRMTLADRDELGYWEQRGWDEQAVVRTMSRIDAPESGDAVSTGAALVVTGIAFAGDRGIGRVEVSADGGTSWLDAEIERGGDAVGPLAWVRWRRAVTLREPGVHRIVVRATDGAGALQSGDETSPLPSGATGWHAVEVVAT